jgi:D-alanine--poly(phosphoribitol) ligase subunit 1
MSEVNVSPVNYNPVYPFSRHTSRSPGRIALWVDGQTYSYAELADRSRRIAAWIHHKTGGRGRRVAILSRRTLAAYVGILGSCWAGACYVPLNPAFPEKRLLAILDKARPDALIVDTQALSLLTPAIRRFFLGRILLGDSDTTSVDGEAIDGLNSLSTSETMAEPVACGPNAEAYLVFTSGSTGAPNGVVISAGSLAFAIKSLSARYPFTAEDRFSQFFDLSFDFSVMDLFVPWHHGASTYVVPDSQKLAPGRFIIDHHLTVWTCVPSLITLMTRMKMLRPGIFPVLRLSCFSGETLTAEAARLWQDSAPNGIVVNLYGQTEAPIGSMAQTFAPDAPLTEETMGVALGTPLEDIRVAILGKDGGFVPQGQVGELALSGPHVAACYLDSPQRTTEKFQELAHPQYGLRTWYLTGDLARQAQDGVFHFLGRADNELKVRGHRVMLEEVEYHLRQASGCSVVAVVPWRSASGDIEGLVGFVVGKAPDEKSMKNAMLEVLPKQLVPRRILFIDEMPLSQNGKIDRKVLEEMSRKRS